MKAISDQLSAVRVEYIQSGKSWVVDVFGLRPGPLLCYKLTSKRTYLVRCER